MQYGHVLDSRNQCHRREDRIEKLTACAQEKFALGSKRQPVLCCQLVIPASLGKLLLLSRTQETCRSYRVSSQLEGRITKIEDVQIAIIISLLSMAERCLQSI